MHNFDIKSLNDVFFQIPFPYTSVEDYEAVVRQPLGKEWNPQRIHMKLIQPPIITKVHKCSFPFLVWNKKSVFIVYFF